MSIYDKPGIDLDKVISYDNVEELKTALVGRAIERIEIRNLGTYRGEVDLVLDNGDTLTAYEADGRCACANGCFDLAPKLSESGTILNVEVEDSADHYSYGEIKLFIYTELGKQEVLASQGEDNGYYGWGYHLYLKKNGEK